ncbi:MAG: MarR family winged helix-turn-helix transcriptional regulator [Firmicutes bacterium]|nr:MarR family winged helix-turn-helix transcriptional regulator [Lachnospiraceae bacterium]MDD6065188.1 MarR family winged helix-turn-helix transcriptional regulator [Bacillota bacterium]MDY2819955.1 MarR family winged helix-turn-helix transcriptional regulator [Hominisplanchenecus sp.]
MDSQMESILQGGSFKKLLDEQILELRQKYDMKKAELEILYFLSRCGGHNTSTDIHYQLMMNRGHISQAVDGLCRRKLITAIPDQEDRRYVHYEVLDSAGEIVAEMTKRREAMNRKILEGISEDELRVFYDVSAKIRKNIETMIQR